MLVATERVVERFGLTPLARVRRTDPGFVDMGRFSPRAQAALDEARSLYAELLDR